MSADNQQERLEKNWIVGFTDGEGCFSVSIFKNKTSVLGWQLFPEFTITQGAKSLNTLKGIKKFFECGKIFVNRRCDNHRENLYRYCVRSIRDLQNIIIPFFKKNHLQTSKRNDFEYFAEIIELMKDRKHFVLCGLKKIAKITQKMNRQSKSKFLESSETIRQNPKNKG